MEVDKFKQTKNEFLLRLSVILRTVVTIHVNLEGIEMIESVTIRQTTRFKRDSERTSGYVIIVYR